MDKDELTKIERMDIPSGRALVAKAAELAEAACPDNTAPPGTTDGPMGELGRALATIGTNVWRLRQRVDVATRSGVGEEVAKMHRNIDGIWDALTDLGVEIKDRLNEQFDYGMPEKVICVEPRPGLGRETVVETLRPTIYVKRQIIQQGEIVVGKPIEA